MQDADTGPRLKEIITKAIADCELTHSEHQEIVAIVHSDHVVDDNERELLGQLQEMIANGMVKKVKD